MSSDRDQVSALTLTLADAVERFLDAVPDPVNREAAHATFRACLNRLAEQGNLELPYRH